MAKTQSSFWLICGLCAIAASTMIVEIVLTKFVGYKVYHHFIHLIISTVILSFGMAGAYLYLAPKTQLNDWSAASREAALYSVLLAITVVLFCWMPIDPYNFSIALWLRLSSIAIYFAMFAVPFFFAGLCISRVLASSNISATRVYFFDLSAAALAASLTPTILEHTGGYGSIGIASLLGIFAYFAFQKAAGKFRALESALWTVAFLAASALLLVYPAWAVQKYGFDIRSAKDGSGRKTMVGDFGGLARSYWTPLARIDVSKTGWSNRLDFLFGIVPDKNTAKMEGRFISVDGGANTRQFKSSGKLEEQPFFSKVLWASPYVLKPEAKDALVIGGGGGVDIIVGKYHKVAKLDALELNPATYKHLLLGQEDPEAALYQPWLTTNESTKVTILNTEARHFASMHPDGQYDIIQASGVDTLTAVASGALANSDNYLYTVDAVRGYAHMLKPGGVLSLTHWVSEPPQLELRMFLTYIKYLEESGNKAPQKNLIVLANNWVNTIMKTTPFTEEEVQRVREWASLSNIRVLYDPFHDASKDAAIKPDELIFEKLANADSSERQKMVDALPYNVKPVTDDCPYFYQLSKELSFWGSSNFVSDSILAVYVAVAFVLVLIFAPLLKTRPLNFSSKLGSSLGFFASCGFAFLLFEVSIIQLFSVFVGGPVYSLAVVLVSVLAGYSVGCLFASYLKAKRSVFVIVGLVIFAMLLAASAGLPAMLNGLMASDWPTRISISCAVAFVMSFVVGIPVSLAMESVKNDSSIGNTVPWMWGVSSGFNALGAACFVLITQSIGIAATLSVAAALYLFGTLLFALLGPLVRPANSEP
ncbi:MAG: hypothetical protein WCT03_07070 [Candidatus Obscuribacterales bacterium]|jgi:spermidine synthase